MNTWSLKISPAPRSLKIIVSVVLLLVPGHIIALSLSNQRQFAWIIVTGYYAVSIIASLLWLLNVRELKAMFSKPVNWGWNLVMIPVLVLVTAYIFIPNKGLLRWNHWLVFHTMICLVNPFMEELYWRGLISKISTTPLYSFLFSTLLFSASHPLIFGVVSPGVAGWTGFFGTFIVGALFWWCYFKTGSLWGSVINHFLFDVGGMAIFILADKAKLAPVHFLNY